MAPGPHWCLRVCPQVQYCYTGEGGPYTRSPSSLLGLDGDLYYRRAPAASRRTSPCPAFAGTAGAAPQLPDAYLLGTEHSQATLQQLPAEAELAGCLAADACLLSRMFGVCHACRLVLRLVL